MRTQSMLRQTLATMACGLLLAGPAARAQDIEVFGGVNPSSTGKPNVLIVLDNTSNWNSSLPNGQPAWDPELLALANTIKGLVTNGFGDKVRVGLMMFTPGGVGLPASYGSGSGDGGYVRFTIRDMNATNAAQLAGLALGIRDKKLQGGGLANEENGSNNAAYAQTMAEAYYYYFGKRPRVGFGDQKRDCGSANTNNTYTRGTTTYYNLFAPPLTPYGYTGCGTGNIAFTNQFNATAANASVNYVPPPDDGACQRNFIVFISNGPIDNSDNAPGLAMLQAAVAAEGAGASYLNVIPVTPNGETQANFADEWARFLNKFKNVQTYTINTFDKATGQSLAHDAMMKSMAISGGGDYCNATDPDAIARCLDATFNKILAVNSVFAAVTLPVAVNPYLQNLDQVYMGVFRPDAEGNPRWFGNLKQYRLSIDVTGTPYLADATGARAVNSTTGQFFDNAVSYWTQASSYWAFAPRGLTSPNSDSPDGPLAEKGGAAQRLRTVYAASSQTIANRKVLTCVACTTTTTLTGGTAGNSGNTSFSPLNSASWVSKLRVADTAAAQSLINWTRGENTTGEKLDAGTTEARPSIHGDVLHSRPAILTLSTTNIYLFYGANDGMLRAIKGGRASDGGNEVWSFLPEEFFPRLARLRDNTPVNWAFNTVRTTVALVSGQNTAVVGTTTGIQLGMLLTGTTNVPPYTYVTAIDEVTKTVTLSMAATATSAAAANFVADAKPYFFDGPITVYTDSVANKRYLVAAMRRGGRFLYAFDITNPDVPKFLWRKGCDHAGFASGYGCDSGYTELGQTWSEPRVARIGTSGDYRTVLIFGAGYDAYVEDQDPVSDESRSMGRGVFVVDIDTGDVLRRFGSSDHSKLSYSVPSDITIIDFDGNGTADRLYFGDTGGQLWRIDTNANKDPSGSNWSLQRIASLGIDANSGDQNRRKFLFAPDVVETAPGSGIYSILVVSGDRENPLNGATGRSSAPLVANRAYMVLDGTPRGSTVVTESVLDDRTTTYNNNPSNLGWYVTLTNQGEKGTGSVITLAGAAYFGTNYPTAPVATACQSTLGNARYYTLDYLTSGGRGGGSSTPSSNITDNRFSEIQGGGLPASPVGTLVSTGTNQIMEGVIMGPIVLPVGPAKIGDRFRNYWFKKFDKQ